MELKCIERDNRPVLILCPKYDVGFYNSLSDRLGSHKKTKQENVYIYRKKPVRQYSIKAVLKFKCVTICTNLRNKFSKLTAAIEMSRVRFISRTSHKFRILELKPEKLNA